MVRVMTETECGGRSIEKLLPAPMERRATLTASGVPNPFTAVSESATTCSATALDEMGAPPLEHIHQPRAVERRGNRVLLRFGNVEAPLVDRQARPATRRELAQRSVDLAVPVFVVQRMRHQVAQVAVHFTVAVVVVNCE